jgi:hypothetical protein
MKKVKIWFRQLFCQHSFHLNRWHWCHGPNGNDPIMIECEYRCSKCGKLTYRDLSDDRENAKAWADFHRDKEWGYKYDS